MISSVVLLTDKQLMIVYRQAKEQGILGEFILLLQEEINRRKLFVMAG